MLYRTHHLFPLVQQPRQPRQGRAWGPSRPWQLPPYLTGHPRPLWQPLLAALLTLILPACSTPSVVAEPVAVKRELPPLPADAVPVVLPKVQPGTDAVIVAGRFKLAAEENGRRLVNVGTFYDKLRRDYGAAPNTEGN